MPLRTIIQDVTERVMIRVKLDEAARETHELRAALDAHAIVAVTDQRGVICQVNDKFCEISGYSREELLGNTHRIINSGHHKKDFFVQLWRTISRGQVWEGEVKNRAKDGTFVGTEKVHPNLKGIQVTSMAVIGTNGLGEFR